ncbi:MAG: hypothetical protein JSV49_04690 [Thermoplasmata archaeon]|nr:MAG: hypothetical protein JSV49_04690 [Thermoplasmata archaeon]
MNKIAYYSELPDPITDRTKRMAMVLGREMTGKILASLYITPFQSASDIAKLFNIHIATAQKYLVEMRECGLLNSRLRKNSTRPTDEYWLTNNQFDINVNLENMPKLTELELKAANTYIRQKFSENVAFDTNRTHQTITEIILLNGRERTQIDQRIKLDDVEGRFTWHLPSPNDPPMSILELVKKANLPLSDLPRIMDLVEKLATIEYDSTDGLVGIIERRGVIQNE